MATSESNANTTLEDSTQPGAPTKSEDSTQSPTHPRAKDLPEGLSIDRDEILNTAESWIKEKAPQIFQKFFANSPYSGKDGIFFSEMSDEDFENMPAHVLRICKFKKEPWFRLYCCEAHIQLSAQMETHPDMVWGNTGVVIEDLIEVMNRCGYVYREAGGAKQTHVTNYYFKHPDYLEIKEN